MKVVHCKKEHYDVYIGRPSKWGNPFVIGKDGTRNEVLYKYCCHLYRHPELRFDIYELTNKILGCWCAPEPCHGDILTYLAHQDKPINKPKWEKHLIHLSTEYVT